MLLLTLIAIPSHDEPLARAVAGLLVAAVVGYDAVNVAGALWKTLSHGVLLQQYGGAACSAQQDVS